MACEPGAPRCHTTREETDTGELTALINGAADILQSHHTTLGVFDVRVQDGVERSST